MSDAKHDANILCRAIHVTVAERGMVDTFHEVSQNAAPHGLRIRPIPTHADVHTPRAKAENSLKVVPKVVGDLAWPEAEVHGSVGMRTDAAHALPRPDEGGLEVAAEQETRRFVEELRLQLAPGCLGKSTCLAPSDRQQRIEGLPQCCRVGAGVSQAPDLVQIQRATFVRFRPLGKAARRTGRDDVWMPYYGTRATGRGPGPITITVRTCGWAPMGGS